MASHLPQVIFGTGFFGNAEPFISDKDLEATYDLISMYGVKQLDTAQLYGESERRLGETNAGARFSIDTKWLAGWTPGMATKDGIITTAKESRKKVGCVIDIFYLHSPDVTVPLEETLAGVNEAHKLGLFERFGLSNYSTEEVVKVYDHCKAQGYVLPSVFQGNYAPVARKLEDLLLPTLRKLGIAFYAYSPLAGGFLTKTKQQILEGAGRFNTNFMGGMYDQMYLKDSYLNVLAKWEEIAEEQGCSRAELAYRWVISHSALKADYGDRIIVGASKFEQIEPTLQGLGKGPLKQTVVKRIDALWDTLRHEAPLDAFSK
ncbi:hypothetical protein H2200_006622 [Cladophialophora chaetospira]|uniref:NADP-dependent oxidoreductase domain-containing protein n=1 Tax=Cladophialophora chaetospira TaxID=386627 RepID=A0AA38X8J7_9EURO|nr:hypothetical protein H2200_006622 [Cladophialophora chaetospira]